MAATRNRHNRETSRVRVVAVALAVAAVANLVSRPAIDRIVISKSRRALTAYDAAGRVVKEFPIALGASAEGHKLREGDLRTPEGEYFVCFKNPKSRFHLSLGLSYPNVADAQRGLADGVIDEAEYGAIVEAVRLGRQPPWKTALGGEIFIHGEMNRRAATRGCVAMANRAIEELFPQVPLGTPVVIEP